MKKFNYIITALLLTMIISSCKKKYTLPPVKDPPANSGGISIDSIRKKYINYYITAVPKPVTLFKFNTDISLTCTVTADENSGNLYKSVCVSDGTGGLVVKLLNSGGLFVGDQIRINLNNVILNDYGKMVQLDSVDIEKSVVKISSGNQVVPKKITFNQMLSLNGYAQMAYQGQLVQIDSVEFAAGHKGKTFADTSVYKYSLDRTLESLNSNQTVIVRTSGYSNFAKAKIPCGKGSIIAIVGQYNSDPQLTLPSYNDVKLSSGGCPIFLKSFESPETLTSGGWSTYNVSGNVNWTQSSYNGQFFAKISNYSGGSNSACESWFISPALNLTAITNPAVSFSSAYNFTGPQIELLASTNYTGGDPSLATWVLLPAALPSTGGYVWTKSGKVSLNSFKTANTRIAIVYYGTSTSGSTWEVDDIAVFGE